MSSVPWLTLVLVIPVGAAILLQVVPRRAAVTAKTVTILATLAVGAIVAGLLVAFTQSPHSVNVPALGGGTGPGRLSFQFEEQRDWIPGIGASYHLGLDGVSAWLLALDAFVFLLGAVVISTRATERMRFYCSLLLLTEAATAGVLLSTDLLLFYLFWEGMLIPLYLLLSSYGDRDRGRNTLKFVIYTVAGSLAMLVAIIYLYFGAQASVPQGATSTKLSFDLQTLINAPGAAQSPVSFFGIHLLTPREFAFLAFVLAFAIKIPLVPFHTWLPGSYTSCPPAALTFFAGIVSKLGAFGLIRYGLTLFPHEVQKYQYWLAALALLSILYGALMALAQTDVKRIVAYASVSHLGFIALGIFSLTETGINGAVLQMVNHGVIIAALFLIVGMVEERVGTRDRHEIAGLERRMPWLYGFFLIATLAGLGMPGMGSFVGEFTIMLGAFQASPVLAVVAGMGVVLASWYMLRLHQGLMHDPLTPLAERVRDIGAGQRLVLVPLVALMIAIGVVPRPVGNVSRGNVAQYVDIVRHPPQLAPPATAEAP